MIGLITALVGASACDGGGDLPPPPDAPVDAPPAPPPTQTLDARDAEAWQEIQTRFDAFMETWIKWSAEGSPGGLENPAFIELGEYADVILHGEVTAELVQNTQDGIRRTGRPEWRHLQLLAVDWEREVQQVVVPEAVFEVCIDESEWIKVDADTGAPVPAASGGPQVWTMTAWWLGQQEFGPDGWGLAQREVERGRPC